jgi:3-hydroxyisobutyrate dehydrogenase
MAKNLHRAGLLEAVWNRSRDKALALATELGCQSPATLAEFAASVDVVVICVSADTDVRSVVEGLAPGLRPHALVIDCSTVSAETARWAEAFLAGRGVRFVDAPVSGESRARRTALSPSCAAAN